jgi:hypothetical protein
VFLFAIQRDLDEVPTFACNNFATDKLNCITTVAVVADELVNVVPLVPAVTFLTSLLLSSLVFSSLFLFLPFFFCFLFGFLHHSSSSSGDDYDDDDDSSGVNQVSSCCNCLLGGTHVSFCWVVISVKLYWWGVRVFFVVVVIPMCGWCVQSLLLWSLIPSKHTLAKEGRVKKQELLLIDAGKNLQCLLFPPSLPPPPFPHSLSLSF